MELEELYGLMERFASSGLTELDWRREDGHIWMTGPAVTVFEAEVEEAI